MSLLTQWGYTLTDVNVLPDLLNVAEFDGYTAGKYVGDDRTMLNIKAAQNAARNYCGWHIFPSLNCELSTTFYDKRITKVDGGLLIQLPATFVSAIGAVSIAGTEYESFVLDTNGLLRVYGIDWTGIKPYTAVIIDYTAGIYDFMADGLKDLIQHQVVHAMENRSGVQSETAGGVSVTYNAAWINSTRATDLSSNNKEVLVPYRLEGVF